MMKSMNDLVYICSPDFRIDYLNPAMIQSVGYDAIGEPCYKVIHDLDEKCHFCVHEKVQKGEHVITEIINPKNGLSYHGSHSPIFHTDGSISKMTIYRDITKNKQVEEEIRGSKEELEQTLTKLKETQTQVIQSEKMASVGQLAAGVAHEINNPTGFVSSNLKTLSDYNSDIKGLIKQYRKLIADLEDTIAKEGLPSSISEQVKQVVALETEVDVDFILGDILDLIGDCKEGTERIKKIVLGLKDFAHPGEDKVQTADINKGIESTLNVVWNELKYKATVKKDYGELPEIECYPQQLNQVVMNILVNAAQAMKDQGEIRISTHADNGFVEIKISDTGAGIPDENLSQIFDPFFTTKEVGKGTGLGLNVAYNIVKKHKGDIKVESELGKGTTFKIRIPVGRDG